MCVENSYKPEPFLADPLVSKEQYYKIKNRCRSLPGRESFLIAILLIAPVSKVFAETYDQCLLRQARSADGAMTLSEMRTHCEVVTKGIPEMSESEKEKDLLAERFSVEKATRDNPFVISPHKQNYVLPLSYSSSFDYDHFASGDQSALDDFSRTEIKFQLSLKAPVIYGFF